MKTDGCMRGLNMTNTFEQIYKIVRQIPYGRVTTYGRIALLMGNPRLSRVVGYAMSCCPDSADVPCHRVLNRFGGLADAFEPLGRQSHRALLEMEGIAFLTDGCVNLEHFMWYGPPEREIQTS